MTPTPAIFTASEIGDALGSSAASARRRLAGVRPSGTVRTAAGRPARGWNLAALPAGMRETLASRATECRFDGPEDLLADAANPQEWVIEFDLCEPEGGQQ